MELNRRDLLLGGLFVGLLGSGASAQEAARTTINQLTEEQLGTLLAAMGLKPEKTEQRYDFRFRKIYDGEEWELTMSAVLSKDNSSIWLMAWLDELPRSAADVPRTALLRLLAENDRLGSGKFFTYIASNRRFVMQQVVENKDMNTAKFAGLLSALGQTVVETYPFWAVENWASTPASTPTSNDHTAPANPSSARKTGNTSVN